MVPVLSGDPLRASLKGPSGDVQANSSLTFTAAGSFDPSDPAGALGAPLTWVHNGPSCRDVRDWALAISGLICVSSTHPAFWSYKCMLVLTVHACRMMCESQGLGTTTPDHTHTHPPLLPAPAHPPPTHTDFYFPRSLSTLESPCMPFGNPAHCVRTGVRCTPPLTPWAMHKQTHTHRHAHAHTHTHLTGFLSPAPAERPPSHAASPIPPTPALWRGPYGP